MAFPKMLSILLYWACSCVASAAPDYTNPLNNSVDLFADSNQVLEALNVSEVRPTNVPYFKLDNTFGGLHERQQMTLDEFYKVISIDRFKLLEPEFTTHGTLWTRQENIDVSLPNRALVASVLQESFTEENHFVTRSEKLRHLELMLNGGEAPNATITNIRGLIFKALNNDGSKAPDIKVVGVGNDLVSMPHVDTPLNSVFETKERMYAASLDLLDDSLQPANSSGSHAPSSSSSYKQNLQSQSQNTPVTKADPDNAHDLLSNLYSGIDDRTTNQNPFDNLSEAFGSTTNNDEAFRIVTTMKDQTITVSITMQEGAYLYKDSLVFTASNPRLKFQKPLLPQAVDHQDIQGSHKVYFKSLKFEIPLLEGRKGDILEISSQGCDADGICYPPVIKEVVLDRDIMATSDLIELALAQDGTEAAQDQSSFSSLTSGNTSEQGISATLKNNLLLGLLVCFILGIGLDLTPCVLPMLPIFSAMIIGPKKPSVTPKDEFPLPEGQKAAAAAPKKYWNSHFKTLLLQNSAYALGLSLTYMILGLFFSMLGASFHSVLQSPFVTVTIALLLVVCALACAGVIEFKVPSAITSRLQNRMSNLKTQSASGAFFLGVISALIASPCTSAPLAGALLYVMTSGNIISGALSFFAIGLGMSLPLFIIGLFGASFLHRSGIIGDIIKRILVIALLVTAYFMVKRFLGDYDIVFSSLLVYITVIYTCKSIYFFVTKRYLSMPAILAIALLALVPTYFAYQNFNQADEVAYSRFMKAQSLPEIQQLTHQHHAFVVFTAKWCSNCQWMEQNIYSQPPFLEQSKEFNRIVVDITDTSDPAIKRIIEEYKIIGVPFFMTTAPQHDVLQHHLGIAHQQEIEDALSELKAHKDKYQKSLILQPSSQSAETVHP